MKNKNMIDISDFVGVETIQVVTHNLMNRFRLRRKESRMTQRFLSQMSGVSYASVRRFETSGDISFASLLKLSESLSLLSEFNHLFSRPIIKDIRRDK